MGTWSHLLIASFLVGCTTKDVVGGNEPTSGEDLDTDGDGLSDEQEAELGTDPNSSDTDSDGYSDGDEVAGHTDPLDPDRHPYTGGWPIDACNEDITGSGNGEGDIAEGWARVDQFGEDLSLHDFCDRTVLLVGAAFW